MICIYPSYKVFSFTGPDFTKHQSNRLMEKSPACCAPQPNDQSLLKNVYRMDHMIEIYYSHKFLSFTGSDFCKRPPTRLMEKTPFGITAYCNRLPKDQLPLKNVYRMDKVIGIYLLSVRKSHVCYSAQVHSNMINLTQLSGGKFYEIVN